MIKLSVIIPYYNADQWIGMMLDSLLKQDITEDDYEIIVVDDGSSEEPEVLKSYFGQHPNIRYVRQKNAGPGAARNKGFELATGEYVLFCDSDDYVAENCLGQICQLARGRSLDMLFFNVPKVDEREAAGGKPANFGQIQEFATGVEYFALPIQGSFVSMGIWQFLISRSFILECHLHFPSDMIMNEDACFLIDAILAAGKTAKVDADVYYYVQRSQSLVHHSGKVKQAEKFTSNILTFVRKLDGIIRDERTTASMPAGCLENLKWLRNQKANILVWTGCKNLAAEPYGRLLSALKETNQFPTPMGSHQVVKKIVMRRSLLRMLNLIMGFHRRKKQ